MAAACTAALLETARGAARAALAGDDAACLLGGLQSPAAAVRDAALRALLCLAARLPPFLERADLALTLTMRLYVATFDVDDDNK